MGSRAPGLIVSNAAAVPARGRGIRAALSTIPYALRHSSIVRVLADSAEIANEITGIGGLTKTEAGTLILTGTNSYSGGTTIRPARCRSARAEPAARFECFRPVAACQLQPEVLNYGSN